MKKTKENSQKILQVQVKSNGNRPAISNKSQDLYNGDVGEYVNIRHSRER